jgi:7-cyano-7-deazaguanine synthase
VYRAVAIVSGGMDSTVLAYQLRSQFDELHLLSFDYGQKHGVRELERAKGTAERLGADHSVINLRPLAKLLKSSLTVKSWTVPEGHYSAASMAQTVVPNRNAIMLNIAVGVAISERAAGVWTGVHAGDHAQYPDCRPEFLLATNRSVATGTEGFAIPGFGVFAPYVHLSKAGIAGLGERLGVPWHLTWSCYKGGDKHCGRCGTCVERLEAFHLAGVTSDKTEYEDREFYLTECGLLGPVEPGDLRGPAEVKMAEMGRAFDSVVEGMKQMGL